MQLYNFVYKIRLAVSIKTHFFCVKKKIYMYEHIIICIPMACLLLNLIKN